MRKSHTIKNKLLDVKKALPKNEMDRMNNRGGGRDMSMGMGMSNRGFPRGERGNSSANWLVCYSVHLHKLTRTDCTFFSS